MRERGPFSGAQWAIKVSPLITHRPNYLSVTLDEVLDSGNN